ncbi:MAG TPA: leucine-rich repeat domain-containing protein, partial [Candidatus Saccharimonadales bacterium]|nr:leucine-rich repeat domain-containing protein [Candidatus Saccharimonadales bacterium]
GNGTSIGEYAFGACSNLISVMIPGNVTSIGDNAFYLCSALTSVYFGGNTPAVGSDAFTWVDEGTIQPLSNVTFYYLPGTTGWSSTFAGRPAFLWNPQIQAAGWWNNQFGFNITGTANIPIVLEVCTNLTSPIWSPLKNITLVNGSFFYSEPVQTNIPDRYYRISSP